MVSRLSLMQDVATSLLLAEAVYKALDGLTGEEAVAQISAAASQLPTALQQPLKLQWSLPHVNHRNGFSPHSCSSLSEMNSLHGICDVDFFCSKLCYIFGPKNLRCAPGFT